MASSISKPYGTRHFIGGCLEALIRPFATRRFFAGILALGLCLTSTAQAAPQLTVLAYHDVEEAPSRGSLADTVTTSMLWQQLTWMTDNGFTFISLDTLLKARQGNAQLPPKAALLTFDDGYASMYTQVLPILKRKRIPAVAALVGSWLQVPEDGVVRYGDQFVSRARFLSRDQARALTTSGLVEFASHTFDLHKGIKSNPQGNFKPAAITAALLEAGQSFESPSDYAERVRLDLLRNQAFIKEFALQTPRAIVWPFGRYTGWTNEMAKTAGLELAFSLDDTRFNPLADFSMGRKYIRAETTLADFASYVQQKPRLAGQKMAVTPLMPATEALDPSERSLSLLMDTLQDLNSTSLALTLPDESGSCLLDNFGGQVSLSRLTWQAHTRLGLQIWLEVSPAHPCFNPSSDVATRIKRLSSLGVFQGVLLKDIAAHPVEARRLLELLRRYLGEHQVFADTEVEGVVGLWRRVPRCKANSSDFSATADDPRVHLWHLTLDDCPLAPAQAELSKAGITLTAFDLTIPHSK